MTNLPEEQDLGDVFKGIAQELLQDPTTAPLVVETSEQGIEQQLEKPVPSSQTVSPEVLDSALDRKEREGVIRLRTLYSVRLLWFLGIQLAFMNVVLILNGTHEVSISDATMQFYLTGTLGEVFGLVALATKFLFSNKQLLGTHGSRAQ